MTTGHTTMTAALAVARTPGTYADLSHVIAAVTILMAVLSLTRLRPALRGQRSRRATLPVLARMTAIALALACLLVSGPAHPAVRSQYLAFFRRPGH